LRHQATPTSNQMPPFSLSNLEYVSLRLVRRFLFPADLQRIGRYLPFYRTNLTEVRPDHVCQLYRDALAQVDCTVDAKHIVEVGSGSTNAAGYALVCAGATHVWCVEPYVAFDADLDARMLVRLAEQHNRQPDAIRRAVQRCASFADV